MIVDEATGVIRRAPGPDIYRTQIGVALWKAAHQVANTYVTSTADLNQLPHEIKPFLVAIVTFVFAANSVRFEQNDATSAKNYFPQLLKTSPCSVFRCISEMTKESRDLNTLHILRKDVETAYKWFNHITPQAVIGELPGHKEGKVARPYDENTPYAEMVTNDGYGLLVNMANEKTAEAVRERFRNLWDGTFNLEVELNEDNNFGFTGDAPFHVFWGPRTKTKLPPAKVYQGRDGKQHIRVIFESRYGNNKLNIGFNPFAVNNMFIQSYLSLIQFVAPHKVDEAIQVLEKVYGFSLDSFVSDKNTGTFRRLVQHFEHGPH